MNQNQLPTVGILIFDDVEVLDFCGPFEVFSVARPAGENTDEFKLFNVVTIAEEDKIITCRGGLLVKPQATIENHPPIDILVVPGGQGTRRERHNSRLLDWIVQQDQRTNLTTSVCTGAFLLAESNLLDHHRATTHWASIEWMRNTYPTIEMVADARVVDQGHIITSAGISAGIDMSLHVVSRLYGIDVAEWLHGAWNMTGLRVDRCSHISPDYDRATPKSKRENHMSSRATSLLDLQFHPVTAECWSDLETLFGKNGAYANCWCMSKAIQSNQRKANSLELLALLAFYRHFAKQALWRCSAARKIVQS